MAEFRRAVELRPAAGFISQFVAASDLARRQPRIRVALERLCRYILRPPLAVKRLERLPGIHSANGILPGE